MTNTKKLQKDKDYKDVHKDDKVQTAKTDAFTTIVNLLIKTGILLKGARIASAFINKRVGEVERDVRRALLIYTLLAVGGILLVFGFVHILAESFGHGDWDIVITGLILLAGGVILKIAQKDK
ncbi:MAG: hypothetical protein ACKKL4_00950 [Patescibacteria group bacterium]